MCTSPNRCLMLGSIRNIYGKFLRNFYAWELRWKNHHKKRCIYYYYYFQYGHKTDDESSESSSESLQRPPEIEELKTKCQDDRKIARTRAQQEKRLKNTFGWARIDVISMLICCVFLASLCFSIVLDGLQTLVHIDHKDEMHHPIAIMCIGGTGLLLNGLCYLLIGGKW